MMRISSVTMYDQGISQMNRQQSGFLKISEQIASGRRVVNPSDDPQAAARAVGVDQSKAMTQQYSDSRVSARNSLSQTESVLNSVSDAVTSAKTLLVQAANGTLSDADRESAASELRGIYETVIGQANVTDGNGHYLFGGYADNSEPFVKGGDGVQYVGDSNNRQQRIDSSRLMSVTETGDQIFQSVPSGTNYVAEAAEGNAGSVSFTGPKVTDQESDGYGESYRVTFVDDGDAFEVQVKGDSGWEAVGGAQPYDPGGSIAEEGGLRLELKGSAKEGDSIEFSPAKQMNTDLFKTFERAISALETPTESSAAKAALSNAISTSMREFDNSLDNVLTTRASVGARLNELDVVDGVSEGRMLNYEQQLSDLVDLNFAEAIGDYSLRKVGLQASQQAFVSMRDMSLFNYL